MKHKIHVLLVDHDNNHEALVVDMLRYYSYEVTTIKLASTALSILSKGKSQFDLLMVNINSPDFCGFQLLQDATKMDLPVILLLDEDDPMITRAALEEGAILCIQKPMTMGVVKYLWQHVLREKINRQKEHKRVMTYYELHNGLGQGNSEKDCVISNSDVEERPYKSKKKMRGPKIVSKNVANNNPIDHERIKFKKKVWTEWTQELHEKFMNAVRVLGEGRCYPKDILELMDVSGLTRMQVASHLQKCRRGTWQSDEGKRLRQILYPETASSGTSSARAKSKRFGSLPRINNAYGFPGENSYDEEPKDCNNGYNPFENFEAETTTQHLGTTLGIEQFLFDAQTINAPNNIYMNTIEDNFTASTQQEIIGLDYNVNLQALDIDHVDPNQIPIMHDKTMEQRSHEASKSEINNGSTHG